MAANNETLTGDSMLTLQDFINGYQRLVITYENPTLRQGFTNTLINRWYMHIRDECNKWLDNTK